jgi:hypothetical protein
MKNWLQSIATGMLLERPAQKLTLDELAAQLESSGAKLTQRYATAADAESNREHLRHIVGIERWGQGRLKVFLGAPLEMDEHDAYCPADDLGWAALQDEFTTTRAKTVALARELAAAKLDTSPTVPHNQYGKLSAYAWLHYLDTHANLESERIE